MGSWRSARWLRSTVALLILTVACLGAPQDAWAEGAGQRSPWYSLDAEGRIRLDLYVFWSVRCPHCREAMGDLAGLRADLPWLDVHAFEIGGNPAHARLYQEMAAALGVESGFVPAFFLCGAAFQGYESDATTGAFLRDALRRCREALKARLADDRSSAPADVEPPDRAAESQPGIGIPGFGALDPASLSLPVLAIILGGLDSFNPCAFFVLLFLLSILVHARSRARMMLVGGVFVLFSGLLYFMFMAAWLNVFLVIGHFRAVTIAAGLLAVAIAGLNIKDFFWFGRGVSLSIPERAKPGLFRRMRGLVGVSSWMAMLAGTAALALAANAYELFCTAGFPMVFTRALTLRELSTGAHCLYLALYNVVYVLPLLAIVVLFAATLGARKLSERAGRVLKLLSGSMMLALGLVLLIAPDVLNNLVSGLVLLLAAGAGTLAVLGIERVVESRRDTLR